MGDSFYKQVSLILFLLLNIIGWGNGAYASDLKLQPEISAQSAILIEASTGTILYEKKPYERHAPASTTKIMTLITALEHAHLSDTVVVSSHAASMEGSTMWLSAGEKINLEDLLYGMMLVSGNDASVAIAEHIGGTENMFVRLMNQEAEKIGVAATHFNNPNGLPDIAHYSTAYDLAKIAAYGYQNPLFRKIIQTQERFIPQTNKFTFRNLRNENKLLYQYAGNNGVKTGYTDLAGRCLVSGAAHGRIQLIAVVLDAPYMWTDAIHLLDYGFSKVQQAKLYQKGDVLRVLADGKGGTVSLLVGEDVALPVIDGQLKDFQVINQIPDTWHEELSHKKFVGTLEILYKGRLVKSIPVVYRKNKTRQDTSFFQTFWNIL